MKIAIGSDNLGLELKEFVKKVLTDNSIEFIDAGVFNKDPMDYPDIAEKVADMVVSGECERGILVCGTGIGMAIAANKVEGIRAAVCHDPYSAERSIKSNDVQIMALGALVVGQAVAKSMVETWIKAEFTGGPSAIKINKIMQLEKRSKMKEENTL